MASNDDPFEDISELQRELERRDKEMLRLREENARLMGKAAHDLRHPVSALLTYSELLLESDETALNDDNRALVIEMRRCGELMRKMLDDVFEIARLDSIRFDWEPAAVEELVTQSVDDLTSMAVRKKIQIQVAAEIGIPIVRVDKARMVQAFSNIVCNAIKFSPIESSIHIRIARDGTFASVCVQDSGPGIPDDEIENIFRPFSRTRARAASKEPGTGFGLAISTRILERHGGRIWVESSGKGSAFFIALPLSTEREPAFGQRRE